MKQYTNKEIRDFIKCPQFGDIKYGKWGFIRLDVKQTLLNLLNINDSMDYLIKQQYQELQRKDNIIILLKKWLEEQHQFIIETPAFTKEISQEHKVMECCYEDVLDKINELEGDNM